MFGKEGRIITKMPRMSAKQIKSAKNGTVPVYGQGVCYEVSRKMLLLARMLFCVGHTLDRRRTRSMAFGGRLMLRNLSAALVSLSAVLVLSGFRAPYFSRLTVDDGLSQNTVFTVCQDSTGMMWFGTMDGLSRYDGYEFRVWRNAADEATSLQSDIVKLLFVDAEGRIWAGSDKGLSLYKPESESFENWNVGEISGLAPADGGELYAVAGGQLKIFNPEKGEWRDGGLGGGISPSVLSRDGDCLWIGGREGGLYRMDMPGRDVRKIPELSSRAMVTAIFRSGANLWVATEGDGLWKIILDGKTCIGAERIGQKDGLPSNFVRSVSTDGDGRLWVGTYGGLSILDGDVFRPVIGDASIEGALSQNSVRCICRDNQGGMWLGTYYGGVNWWHPLKNRFSTLRRDPSALSLNDNVVNCISEDASGRLWIGTNTGGVNCWNPSAGTFRYWSVKSGQGIGNMPEADDVKALWIDDAGRRVYVGAHAGGLSCIDVPSGIVTRFSSATSDGNSGLSDVYSIVPFDGGRKLWLGTLGGLQVFDRSTGKIESPAFVAEAEKFSAMQVRALLLSEGRIWAGGGDGLIVFTFDGISLALCADISAPAKMYVQSLLEIPGKYVLAGTRDGLWSYAYASREWTRYTSADGLPGNIIDGMVADKYGMIWVSTDKGISRFNPFSVSFRNYTAGDGLPSNQFNPNAGLGRTNGEIMFGGSNGITYFNPEFFTDNPYSPKPIITDFSLTGKYESGNMLPHNGEIRLPYDKNSFAVSFSVPNYLSGKHNTFAYMLEGYDDTWIVTDNARTAFWSNLPHGKYVFKLKSANSDGKWCDKEVSLKINIAPVWWKTVPAIIAFSLLFIMIVAGLCLLLIRRKDRQRKQEIEAREKSHQEEIQQMKTQFFINISHEMRSPLMLIINPLSEIIAKCGDTAMRRQLRYVDRNARRLLHLVNQLIDYRRAELGVFRLNVRQESVLKLIRENWSAYEPVARKKGLKYRLDSTLGGETACLDAQYLELILSNLLSNAIKYTESGSVTLYAGIEGGELVIRVSDTGSGIPEDKQGRIFERFYQVERDYVGSGIGLSLVQRLVELHHGKISLESEPGKGSEFTVRLPISEGAYSQEEKGDASTTNVRDIYAPEPEGEDVESIQPTDSATSEEAGGALLIAEDNKEMAAYLKDALSDRFEIRIASNTDEALDSLTHSKPDAVITDINLPTLDGLKLCSQIKRDVATSGIPVIVISSSTEEQDQLAAFRAGADDFISKPFSLTLLQAQIRNMLRTRARLTGGAETASAVENQWGVITAYDEELLAKAAAIVADNMDNADFSTADFASEMGMSRSNLHLKLKTLTGESALDFIRRIRFKEACRLLKDGRYSISVISDMVGFNSPSYFATCFKRYMGCLPTEWNRKRD